MFYAVACSMRVSGVVVFIASKGKNGIQSTQNRKDHKQILTSPGNYPGSNTTQEAATVKVETGSVSVTA